MKTIAAVIYHALNTWRKYRVARAARYIERTMPMVDGSRAERRRLARYVASQLAHK